MNSSPTYTAFAGTTRLASGQLAAVAMAVKAAETAGASGSILIYDDTTGHAIDLDTRGSTAEVAARYGATAEAEPRGRGRPKLGVVPREVTLLPRQWDWLAAQPGGASVTLRKLVEEARKRDGGKASRRAALDAAYHFMSAMAGNLPHFEDAIRALYADDRATFARHIDGWPRDINGHALKMAYGV
ncbi:DUF2239 family protein [Dongia sp.]|uniref:DUF2239 family protein n=1 Tax=Dongia sp. TaxID=1977262 RepID=UPI0035ADCE2C